MKFALIKSQKIDLIKLGKIVYGAGYTTKKLELEAKGDIVESGKGEDGKAQYEFKLETGQTFPIEGTYEPKSGVWISGELQGWDSWLPKIRNLKEVGT